MDPVTMAVVGASLGAGAGFLGGSKGKKAEYNPYGQLNPEQIGMLKAVAPGIQERAAAGPQLYKGELTAGMSPEEVAFYNPSRAGLMAQGLDQNLREAQDPTALNDAFRREVADPTYQNFQMNDAAAIGENYAGFSTARANALSRAQQTLSNNLLQQRFAATQAAKDRALNSYGKYADVGTFAAAPRVFQQAGLDRKYADYVRANEDSRANIDKALGFLGLSTGTYTPGTPDTRWSGALGGALQGGLMGASMGSMFGGGAAAGSPGGVGAGALRQTPTYFPGSMGAGRVQMLGY